MRNITPALTIVLLLGVAAAGPAAIAQAQTATESPAAAPASPPAAAPANPVATAPELQAKDLKGLDAFGSDGQQVGKVVNVNVQPDGKVKDAEIRSSGFFGFFASAYVVPADKLSVKGGRVAISLTADEVKKLTK